jgi:Mor family transcriptional regulator
MQVAETAMDAIRKDYGGGRVYIPALNGDARKKIVAEFNGRNIAELSARYGLSAQTIRNYVRK